MERQTLDGAMPWRYVLNLHPPWVHWSFFVLWAITATLGPIAVVVGLLDGSGMWWIGLAICASAVITIGIDCLILRRVRRDPDWRAWELPRWPSGH